MKQRVHIKEKCFALLITIFVFFTSLSTVNTQASSEDFYPGCVYENGEILCTSTGELSSGHYVFAGGSACCGCIIRHNGTLPINFPETTISSVIFYLTTSRNNSYYTTIENGPTDLKFILNNQESIATSIQLPTTSSDPVQHSWYLKFDFMPSVSVKAGTPWELIDGDDNIYSAVWLHGSDVNPSGLPGMFHNSNCQYAETKDHWYSVKFITGGEPEPDEEPDTEIIEVSSCIEINEPGYYKLMQDITDCSSDLITFSYSLTACVFINADNVIFDGNNHLIDGTGNMNSMGIRINGKNVTVKNVILNDWGTGILPNSEGNIENNTISNNLIGLWPMDDTNNCTIKGNIILNNSKYGVCFSRTDNNFFTDNKVIDNDVGMFLLHSDDNLFYNNLFNNGKNVEMEDSQDNIWNVEKEQKNNIVNGKYCGGNAWYHPSGYGFSQTCPDENDDRICDRGYNIDGSNIDAYPLASPRPDITISEIVVDNPDSWYEFPGFFRVYTFRENSVYITVAVKNMGEADGKAVIRLEDFPDGIGKQIRMIDVPQDKTVSTTFHFNLSDYDKLWGWTDYGFNSSKDYSFTVNVSDVTGNFSYDMKTDKITVKIGPKIEVYADYEYDSDDDMKIELGEYFLLTFFVYNAGDEDVDWIDLDSDLRFENFQGHDLYNVKTDGLQINDVWNFDQSKAYLRLGNVEDMSDYTMSEVAEKFQWQPTATGIGQLNFDIEYTIDGHRYYSVSPIPANFSIYDYSGKTLIEPQITEGRDFEVTITGVSGNSVVARIKNTGGVYYTYKIDNVPTCVSSPCTDELLSFLAPGGQVDKTITTKGVATNYKFKVQYDYSSVLNTIDGLLNAVSPILPSPLDNVPLLIDIVLVSTQGNIDEKKLAETGVSYLLDELTDPASKYHKAIITKVTQKYGSTIANELATELAGGGIVELPMALYKGFEWAWNNIKADAYHSFYVTVVDPPAVYTVNSSDIQDPLYFGSLCNMTSDTGAGDILLSYDKNGKGYYSASYEIDTVDTSLSDLDFSMLSKLKVLESGEKSGNEIQGVVTIEIYFTDNVSSDAYSLLLAEGGLSESLLDCYFEKLTAYHSRVIDDHVELSGNGILRTASFHDSINNSLLITEDKIFGNYSSSGDYADISEKEVVVNASFGPYLNVPLSNTKLTVDLPYAVESLSPQADNQDGMLQWNQVPQQLNITAAASSYTGTPGFEIITLLFCCIVLVILRRKQNLSR